MSDKATKPIRVSDDAHARLRIFKERYGVSAFSDVILRLTQEVDSDIDQKVARFLEIERRAEEDLRKAAGQ